MATFSMVPDGIAGGTTNNWKNWCLNINQNLCGAADHSLVDDLVSTNSYIHETLSNSVVTFTMTNPSVPEANIADINTVTIKIHATYTETGQTKTLKVEQTGTGISNGYDSHTITSDSYPLYTGAAETKPDSSVPEVAWSYTNLENLRVKLTLTQNAARNKFMRVSYIYAEVDYDPVGYSNDVMGIDSDDISGVMGIATGDISKVNGV